MSQYSPVTTKILSNLTKLVKLKHLENAVQYLENLVHWMAKAVEKWAAWRRRRHRKKELKQALSSMEELVEDVVEVVVEAC